MSKMWAIFSREKVKGGKQVVCINGDYEENVQNKKIETEEFTSVFSLVK